MFYNRVRKSLCAKSLIFISSYILTILHIYILIYKVLGVAISLINALAGGMSGEPQSAARWRIPQFSALFATHFFEPKTPPAELYKRGVLGVRS
jgi:hypothetical protein